VSPDVAVVTGASSGIGAATARRLAEDGWDVVLGARRLDRLEEVATSIGARALPLDVTDQASVDAFVDEVPECRLLVNNAGGALGLAPVAEADDERWRWMYEVNVLGTVRVTKALLPALVASGDGQVVVVGSIAALDPYAGGAGYNAAKAAMASWTMTTQLELGDSPIRMIDLQPGDICTDFNDSVRKEGSDASPYEARAHRAWAVVDRNMKAAPKPELVADRIVQLIEEPSPAPRVTIGDTFEAIIAPKIFGLLPPRWRIWSLRRYYGI